MKIGYILNYDLPLNLPRGDAIHVSSFIVNVKALGHNIFLIRKNVLNEKVNAIKSYNIECPTKLRVVKNIVCSVEIYRKISLIIKEEMPDIIHEREVGWRTYLYFWGVLLAKKYNIPYILEVNAPILYERGVYHSYLSRKIEQISEKILFAKSDKIIVVSTVLKKYLLSVGVPNEKIAVIPNGADDTMFNPDISGYETKKLYSLERKKVICFSGSLDQKWQGIEDILKAAQIINSIDSCVRFLIVGNTLGQKELLKGTPENVIFAGSVEHQEVPKYLAAADILLAPYKLKEEFKKVGFYNSPVKLFEYMAMGKPIITSNIGQISEVIEHGRTGLLIEPGNYNELASSILKLVENQQLRDKLGFNARVEFEKRYKWEMNAMKVISVYEELFNK